jgi:glutamate 5-kinase
MRTKIEAARIATQAGVDLVIAQGREPDAILRLARGEEIGTRFVAQPGLSGRKRWIAYGRSPAGTLVMNDCARKALLGGSSLLPIGIVDIEGEFDAGALVAVRDSVGDYGRGLVNFSSGELRRVAGQHSSQIAALLGRSDCQEAIHRDNLTIG